MKMGEKQIFLVLATKRDAVTIHNLKKEAFMPLYEKYHDDETSPALEALEKTKQILKQEYSQYWMIKYEDEDVGAIRIRSKEPGVYTVGPLFVVPRYQGMGIASQVMETLFEIYEDAHLWKLDTILQEEGNCHLYEKFGFVRNGYEEVVNDTMTLIGYEKRIYTDILAEYDENPDAVINPVPPVLVNGQKDFPKILIMNFTCSIIERWAKMPGAEMIGRTEGANGAVNIYKISYGDTEIAFCMCLTGAPAAVAVMEDLIAAGVETVVVFGSCGVLQQDISDGALIIPTEAVRDEGISYHYQKAGDFIEMDEKSIEILKDVMDDFEYPYLLGKTWTTDAIYRETREKVERRKKMGCIVVEMECSALISAARFRGIQFAQFLYAADNLDAEVWEQRGLTMNQGLSNSERYMQVAFECGIRLNQKRKV